MKRRAPSLATSNAPGSAAARRPTAARRRSPTPEAPAAPMRTARHPTRSARASPAERRPASTSPCSGHAPPIRIVKRANASPVSSSPREGRSARPKGSSSTRGDVGQRPTTSRPSSAEALQRSASGLAVSRFPVVWRTTVVRNGDHDDAFVNGPVDNGKWKTSRQDAARS